jgi:hypothetical protein
VAQKLDMPRVLVSFLERQNGAILFSGALFVSGVHGAQDLLERDDPFSRLPFNIEDLNSDWPPQDSQMLNIGGYGADGSVVCIHRRSLRIYLFKRNNDHLGDEPYNDWPSLENWIASEITRLSLMNKDEGGILSTTFLVEAVIVSRLPCRLTKRPPYSLRRQECL